MVAVLVRLVLALFVFLMLGAVVVEAVSISKCSLVANHSIPHGASSFSVSNGAAGPAGAGIASGGPRPA
jgi:hypothetical protein